MNTTTIPDAIYYVLPDGCAWTAYTIRDGRVRRVVEEATNASHHQASDGRGVPEPGEDSLGEIDGDLASAVLRLIDPEASPESHVVCVLR